MDPRPVASGDPLTPDAVSHQLDSGDVAAALVDVPRAIAVLAALLRQRNEARGVHPTSDVIADDAEEMPSEQSLDAGDVPVVDRDPNQGGEFSLSGLTLGPGQLVVGSVSFSHRVETAPACDEITLWIDDQQNLPTGGLVVMRDGGFAPSREGFSLAMASAEPGVVRAHGRWSVAAPTIDVPRG
jgi:hypothetical protein